MALHLKALFFFFLLSRHFSLVVYISMWSMFSFDSMACAVIDTYRILCVSFSATSEVDSEKYPSYLLPESTEFCLNDLYVVPVLSWYWCHLYACLLFWLCFGPLCICWLALIHHVFALFVHVFLKGCTLEDLMNYGTLRQNEEPWTFIKWQSWRLETLRVCYMLSLLYDVDLFMSKVWENWVLYSSLHTRERINHKSTFSL